MRQFVNQQASEKLTLATVQAKQRLYNFSTDGEGIYHRQVDYYVFNLSQDDGLLTRVDSPALNPGEWHYNPETGTLLVFPLEDKDPTEVELIATYKLFLSNKGITLPAPEAQDLIPDIGIDVFWQGRITSSPGYKHKIGIDQGLTSLVGEGTLKLQNADGGLDDVFDRLIFENQRVVIYSWSPKATPGEAKVIYRGQVTNTSYDVGEISFRIKDQIFNLLDSPEMRPYIGIRPGETGTAETDFINQNDEGVIQRRVYGRVDGLKCIGIDQVGPGREIGGTISMEIGSQVITGVGTTWLTQIIQGDTIVVENQEFEVETIESNTSLTVSRTAEFGFQGRPYSIIPGRASTFNRFWRATGHPCAEVNTTVVRAFQLNRVRLESVQGLNPGDFINFSGALNTRVQIRRIAENNTVVLRQNLPIRPFVGSTVVRSPIQNVYIEGRLIPFEDYDIQNFEDPFGSCEVKFFFPEFNLSRPSRTPFNATFTNGSRVVTSGAAEVGLTELMQPGDFIKPDDVSTTWYKISSLTDEEIKLTQNFVESTTTERLLIRRVNYLNDDSNVSVDILGRTVDNTISGEWIRTAAQVQKDLLTEIGLTDLNTDSFDKGSIDTNALISLALPLRASDRSIPTVKDVADLLNKSVTTSLTLDNDLLVKFQSLTVYAKEHPTVLKDSDIISWSFKSTNGKTYRRGLARYRFSDIDRLTLDTGNRVTNFTSQFVARYIGTNKINELDLYLYNDRDAQTALRRNIYYNSKKVSTLSVTTDLRFENVEIGDIIQVDLRRIYVRKGSEAHRSKIMLVVGKTVTGSRTTLELTDLGNNFNASAYVTTNEAPEYAAANETQRMLQGFITNNAGITDEDENTANTQLIS